MENIYENKQELLSCLADELHEISHEEMTTESLHGLINYLQTLESFLQELPDEN